MKRFIQSPLFFIVFLASISFNCHAENAINDIRNFRQASETHYAAGQPKEQHFAQLQAAGIKHVINLRPKDEQPDINEEQLVTENNMNYHHLPIANAGDLTPENVAALNKRLREIGDEKVLIHCASSNRVGAMMALRANWFLNTSAEDALKIGESYGLTRLKPAVKARLK